MPPVAGSWETGVSGGRSSSAVPAWSAVSVRVANQASGSPETRAAFTLGSSPLLGAAAPSSPPPRSGWASGAAAS